MFQSAQDLTFVLDVVDLFGLQNFNFLEDLGCEIAIALFLLDESNPAERSWLVALLPTPIVLRTS